MSAYSDLVAAVEAAGYPVGQLSHVLLGERRVDFLRWSRLASRKRTSDLARRDTTAVLLIEVVLDNGDKADRKVEFAVTAGNTWVEVVERTIDELTEDDI